MTHLSAEELEIRERAEKATPGPWEVAVHQHNIVYIEDANNRVCEIWAGDSDDDNESDLSAQEMADAEFIAAARTDIPLLLDRLAAARRELAALVRKPSTSLICNELNHCADVMAHARLDWAAGWLRRRAQELESMQLLPAPPAQEHSE